MDLRAGRKPDWHGASWRYFWEDQVRAKLADVVRRVRPLAGMRVDLLRYHIGLRPNPRLEARPARQPRFFFSPDAVPRICALWRQQLPQEAAEVVERAQQIVRHRFDLLGYQNVYCKADIDWHTNPVRGRQIPRKAWFRLSGVADTLSSDCRIIWELNRHQHLVTLAKAYRLTGNGTFASEVFCQWRDWHSHNPYPMGVNWLSSSEVASRALAWCWTYFLLAESPQLPPGFRAEWLRALYLSGRHIETYALARSGPPRLAEGVAMFFIGTLCPEMRVAERWRQRGWELVLREAREQTLQSGVEGAGAVRFERSTAEQVFALDLFLHACVLASLNGLAPPAELESTIEKMLEVLCLLGRAGAPPGLGSNDGRRVFDSRRNHPEHLLDPLSTGAVLFGRPDFKHVAGIFREESLWLLGEQGLGEYEQLRAHAPARGPIALPAAGLYLMANPEREQQLVIDARREGGGVGRHPSSLSLSINRGRRPLLIDPGNFPAGDLRAEESGLLVRPTIAGNTVVVEGRPQASSRRKRRIKVPGGLLYIPGPAVHPSSVKAEAWISGRNFEFFVGSAAGIAEPPVVHRRSVFSLHGEFWLVRDLVLGEGIHGLGVLWHLCPELSRYTGRTGIFVQSDGDYGLRLLAVEGHGWSQEIRQDWWSPVHGRHEPLTMLRFSTVSELPAEFVTLLAPLAGSQNPEGCLRPLRQAPMRGVVAGYRYETSEEEHYMYFGEGRTWTLGLWSSDAEFLYWAARPKSQQRLLICCNGSYVDAAGRRVISCAGPAPRSEIMLVGEHMDVFSSHPDTEVCRSALDAVLQAFEGALPAATLRLAKAAGE